MAFQTIDQPVRISAPSVAFLSGSRGGAARLASRYALVLAFLVAWEAAARLGAINASIFPAPDQIAQAMWKGLTSGTLRADIAISLQRSGAAFALAVLSGIPLGLIMGRFRAIEGALDPILQLFRQTSALALYPVFILIFGLGETSKVFVIFWATLFPILLATIGGVKEVDRKLIEMARTYGASEPTIFRRVILPASVPQIFVGLRLSATTALLLLIAAEMIGANKGLGFTVLNAQYNFEIPTMFAAIFLLAFLGLAANALLVRLQAKLCRWSDAT